MKVKELIEILQECNLEHEVLLACDEEGNSFSPCDSYGELMYDGEGYDCQVRSREEYEEEKEDLPNWKPCIVLWP